MTSLATPTSDRDSTPPPVHDVFLPVMPIIVARARWRFARLSAADREDAVAEAMAAGYCMACSLVERGRADQVPTHGFVAHAIRAAGGGRRVGSSQAACDALSPLGRRRHGRPVISLDAGAADGEPTQRWLHEALADRDAEDPAEIARRNHDYPRMLEDKQVSDKARATFQFLTATHGDGRQTDLAAELMVSPARIT